MNAKKVSSSDHPTAPWEHSVISEASPKSPAGPEVPPYFSWTTKWQVSAAKLWGWHFKTASAPKAAEAEGMDVPPYFSQQPQVSAAELWGLSLKSALMFLAKDFRAIQFRVAHSQQTHRG